MSRKRASLKISSAFLYMIHRKSLQKNWLDKIVFVVNPIQWTLLASAEPSQCQRISGFIQYHFFPRQGFHKGTDVKSISKSETRMRYWWVTGRVLTSQDGNSMTSCQSYQFSTHFLCILSYTANSNAVPVLFLQPLSL